jgi:PTH1 family peptidyl-tRNA hydrolase
MPDQALSLVAGLGNPGDRYSRTRHNIGFIVVDELSRQYAIPLDRTRFDAEYGKGAILTRPVILAKPQSFMNRSGFPVQKLSSYFQIPPERLVVIHDDLDFDLGRILVVKDRGHGGHNGIRSIIEVLGSRDFIRIRVGVGRPGSGSGVTGHVLGAFAPEEADGVAILVKRAAEACRLILEQGVIKAMNQCNIR